MSSRRRQVRLGTGASLALALVVLAGPMVAGRDAVPRPGEILGFEPCADYKLATYEAIDRYFAALDQASDRVSVVEIGRSVDGRPLRLALISSRRNLRRIPRYREIARALALARLDGRPLSAPDADALAAEGKAVVWIDFGLHSTEVAHAQAAPLVAWHVATSDSDELKRIREDVILLLMPNMNPDGTTLVADWYMRHVGTPFEKSRPPELYHRYTGHDNNRDWFMLTMPESQAVARQLYEEWFPQIVYNQHQEAPYPARIFVPPFSDPVNPNIPPLVIRGIATVGDAIARRLDQEGKTGAVSRIQFDAWWNGGMRTAPYFHNMVGILTETAHASATPGTVAPDSLPETFTSGLPARAPSVAYPSPWQGGHWTQRDSCEYMLTASIAVLDIASKRREEWLHDTYRMATAAIEAGRDQAWLVPANQWDPPTATKLVNTLLRGGVQVHEALEPFDAGGERFPAGTFVIPGAQPFRAYARDLLEPQVYPDRRLYPGGPPDRPYDVTGWTLPLQMGVRVVSVHETIDAEARALTGEVAPPAVEIAADPPPTAWALDARLNDSVRAVNRLLRADVRVERLESALAGSAGDWPAGTFLVEAGRGATSILREAARDLGVRVRALQDWPDGPRRRLRAQRLGLYNPWGGSMDEGWTRWLLEQFEFDYQSLRNADIQRGTLTARYDVIVLPDLSFDALLHGIPAGRLPEPYTGGLGLRGVAALYEFVVAGGTLVTLDSASELPLTAFALPLTNALAEVDDSDFFIPGSILALDVTTSEPLAWGVPSETSAFFAHGLAFVPRGRVRNGDDESTVASEDVRIVARYAERGLLQSGWALGGDRLQGLGAVAEVGIEQGRVVLIGFRTQHRAQPHSTFKFLFNAIYR
jgi:hypothetical protein